VPVPPTAVGNEVVPPVRRCQELFH
jgi:hypothetical protein